MNLEPLREALKYWDSLKDAGQAERLYNTSFSGILSHRAKAMEQLIDGSRIALEPAPPCGHVNTIKQGWGDTEGFGEQWCQCGAKVYDHPRPTSSAG